MANLVSDGDGNGDGDGDGVQVFTSDHALKMDWLPKWIAIIGSGYIGLEFSDVYTALGSEVTFVEVIPAPRLLELAPLHI